MSNYHLDVLRKHFEDRRRKNSSYSLRSYAKNLGVQPATLSHVLRAKREIPLNIANSIAARLNLSKLEQKKFLKSISEAKIKSVYKKTNFEEGDHQEGAHFLDPIEHARIISEKLHFAILSLMNTKDFVYDSVWIARRLDKHPQDVFESIERLKKAGLVEEKNGTLLRTREKFLTPDEVAAQATKDAHIANTKAAAKAVLEVPIQLRDFLSMTVATNTSKLPEVKKKLRKFLLEITELMEEEPASEVYEISFQVFPHSKVRETKHES